MVASALIVDDDEFVRTVLTHQLRQLGVTKIATAADGNEAATVLDHDTDFEVILLDLLMPGSDGIELLRRLGASKLSSHLILTTSVDAKLLHTVEMLAVAHGLQLLGSIRKPVTLGALRTLLDQIRTPAKPAAHGGAVPIGELDAALADGRIVPFFQPKIDARTGVLRSVEALARWVEPDGRKVPPSAFVPLAESHGRIDALTRRISAAAIASLHDWDRDGFRPDLEINLSAYSLHHIQLPDEFAALVAQHQIDPRRVTLELTESALVSDAAHSLDTLTRLCLKGFHLAVDDFGTGFATLALLRALPLSELKIDQTFVSKACSDFEARAIVESCIELARSFSLITVAEGVEDADTAELMRSLNVDLLQGFLYSPALPAADLLDWWRRRGS